VIVVAKKGKKEPQGGAAIYFTCSPSRSNHSGHTRLALTTQKRPFARERKLKVNILGREKSSPVPSRTLVGTSTRGSRRFRTFFREIRGKNVVLNLKKYNGKIPPNAAGGDQRCLKNASQRVEPALAGGVFPSCGSRANRLGKKQMAGQGR